MRTDVPLTSLPQSVKPYFLRQGDSLVSDLNVPVESMPDKEHVSLATDYKVCMSPLKNVSVDGSSLIVAPPIRTVTPMLSLYATVKISNIRMLASNSVRNELLNMCSMGHSHRTNLGVPWQECQNSSIYFCLLPCAFRSRQNLGKNTI